MKIIDFARGETIKKFWFQRFPASHKFKYCVLNRTESFNPLPGTSQHSFSNGPWFRRENQRPMSVLQHASFHEFMKDGV
ncbi:hypothetical protein GCM10023166_24880 [Paeniglutamicibacter cryotolerans]